MSASRLKRAKNSKTSLGFLFYSIGALIYLMSVSHESYSASSYSACTDNALNSAQCISAANRYVTSVGGGNVSGTSGSLSVTVPQGYYSGTQLATAADSNLVSSNILLGSSIFGTSGIGGPSCNAFRTVGTSQISQFLEVTTYAGSASVSLPAGYREVPYVLVDDIGYNNSDYGCVSNCTSVKSVTWTQHSSTMVNCGTNQSTIAARLADCATQNGSLATWNPSINGSSGEATWKLVTRNTPIGTCTTAVNSCRPVEVWQDQRTGLLWSSLLAGYGDNTCTVAVVDNWCRAVGSQQSTTVASGTPWPANDPSGYCNNATYQSQTAPVSYCVEFAQYGPSLSPALGTETWSSGIYDLAKGGMGATSTSTSPGVRWRLPTMRDYEAAEIDGIRFVMPDMNAMSCSSEWTATVLSSNRGSAWVTNIAGGFNSAVRNTSATTAIRCVGR